MSETVTLAIDGREITVAAGTTILEAARELGIDIPVICYHPHLTANGLCRLCSVDAGGRLQSAACVTACAQDMVVETGSDTVRRSRRTILELLSSTVDLAEAPEILSLLAEYGADAQRFPDAERRTAPVYDDNPFYLRDYSQCVNCWRCVQVCGTDAQFAFALTFDGRSYHTTIGTLKPKRQALLEDGIDPDEVFRRTRRGLKLKSRKETT
jgi:NADH dehydrogenase/NADH:ubiquinone oxidoreductase subunit G